MNRVLITGADGFTGRYLAAALADSGHEVHGIVRGLPEQAVAGVSQLHVADLGDAAGLSAIACEVQPHKVAHLAAIAFVAHGDVDAIYRTNVVGTRNLLEALVQSAAPIDSVLLASSANVYGNSTGGTLDESTLAAPANDYAVSKLAMEYVARLYADRLPVVIARPFNYTGVGQTDNFLIPKIVSHVRRKAPLIELGNLDVARDFSDVRAVVQYYARLLACVEARGATFNVCSGRAHSLQEVIAMVRLISGHSFDVQVNPAFVRANEVKILVGNRAKLVSAVGEVPDISLQDTLRWMLEDAA
jgi:GDP-6-deoxy-D-talose 4-dehydrogenase